MRERTTKASVVAAVSGLSLLTVAIACSDGSGEGDGVVRAAYVRSEGCVDCHAEIYDAWHGSHHDRAMETATAETVLAHFGGETFSTSGETYRFERDGDRFLVHQTSPEGDESVYEVRYTFGVEPLQQYLIALPGGRMQGLTVAWDTEREAWFTLYPDDEIPSGDPFHWTGRYQNWNAMCAACHSTNLVKGYDAKTDTYDTTWDDIDVGCEACHGPGTDHVAWARGESGDPEDPDRGWERPLRRGDAEAMINACAPCHSRRTQLLTEVTPGTPFLDAYQPQRLGAGLYHADGQILEEVYVYGSFAQSKMHRAGVTCTDCHDAHSLELAAEGNAVCTQCHSQYAPLERFEELQQKVYDSPEHHFHPQDSAGASCVACHMPEKTYMVVDPRRDHSFRVPRPDLAAKLGVPDACTSCHDDQSPDWAAEKIVEWYGPRPTEPHFAEAFAAARAGDPMAGPALARVATDDEQAGIVRATAIEALGPYAPNDTAAIEALLDAVRDPDPLVRSSAALALESFPPPERMAVLIELLDDDVRSVRVEAARSLSSVPEAGIPPDFQAAMKEALNEYRTVQREGADMPWAHLNLGRLASVRGNAAAAEASYRKALALDPGFLPARFNLSHLLNSSGRNEEAERLLRAGLDVAPDEGELHYSLGLLLAEMGQADAAATALADAARLLPERVRVHYNAGLALAAVGRRDEAAAALHRAHGLGPDDPDTLYALVTFYLDGRDANSALPHAQRLVEIVPDVDGPKQLLRQVEEALGAGN